MANENKTPVAPNRLLSPGTRLGPYEVASSLGVGGMGEVYRARDTRLDRSVAIKILPKHLADEPEAAGEGVPARWKRKVNRCGGTVLPDVQRAGQQPADHCR